MGSPSTKLAAGLAPARSFLTAVFGFGLGAAAPAPVAAAEESLARITATNRIVIGAHDAVIPMSYRAPSGEHVGYQMDICERIVAAIRQRHALPQLKIVTVPVTLGTRLALLDNRTVDIDCGPNPVNPGALRHAAMTHATLATEMSVMSTADRKHYTVDDLHDKTLAMTVGGVSARQLRAIARNGHFRLAEMFAKDGGEAFEMLVDGRADAVAAPLPYLLARRALSADPSRYALLDFAVGRVYAGIMFRLDDRALRDLANEVIASLAHSGELGRLYDKWFMGRVPGMPTPVNAPASPAQREIQAAPGSEMLGM